MKAIHISDLHLGKRLHDYQLLEDQEYILDRLLELVGEERPDAVLIAGDIYDKTVPSAEAVSLFDGFLARLSRCGCAVFAISGNHDSPERIAFGASLMQRSGVYFAPVFGGELKPVTLKDEYGEVDVFMLPFIKPAHARVVYGDDEIDTYTRALEAAVGHMPLDPSRRSVLITHQFVTGAARSESEEVSVGGTDNVDSCVFDGFDYVALGHLHTPQSVGREGIRYSGSPLAYSFSEARITKSATVVELREKGDISVRALPLEPKRGMREVRGSFAELMARLPGREESDPYTYVTLTDEDDIPEAAARLRAVFPNLMKLDYDNSRTRENAVIGSSGEVERKSPLELFGELYERQNNRPMSDEQRRFCEGLIAEIWGTEI